MRISVKDPGWNPARDAGDVYIDGVLTKDVIALDTVEGWADVFVRDDLGKLVIDETGKGIVHKRFHGSIRFERYRDG